MDILAVVGVIHHRHFDGHSLFLGLEIYDIVEEVCAMTVDIAHKFFQSVLGMEHFLPCITLFVGTKVGKRDSDTCVQICQFTHTLCYDIVFVCSGGEHSWVRPKLLPCSSEFCLSNNLHWI